MIEAWVLTMTLTRDDIRTGGVFATEKQCTDTGADWYARSVDYAKRTGMPKPKGWLCTTRRFRLRECRSH